MRLECQSCGGTYDSISGDGVPYFHVCSPLSNAEKRALLASGGLVLRPDLQKQFQAAETADAAATAAGTAATNVDALLMAITIERPNKRDENIVTGAKDGKPAVIVAEGAGALELVQAVEPAPVATFPASPVTVNGLTSQPGA